MDDPPSSRSKRGTLAGEIVVGHELLRLLAVGGMGEVYLARHLALGMIRAVKLIRADLRARESAQDRFVREAQVLARLQHNSIVQIVEFGALPNGWPFLAMEYIEGPSLEELIEGEPLQLASALVVLEQLASALHYAHSRGVIHRDLKPSNILARSGDVRQVKLIDFGLARITDADAKRLTAGDQMIGSPAYMAPEQVEGNDDITGAADIYALACLAYTLLSGAPPFRQASSTRLMAAQVLEAPPRLSERCAIPDFLDELLYACLAKDPARRPHGDELLGHLGRLTRGTELVIRHLPRAIEVVTLSASAPSIAAQLMDAVLPDDAEGRGLGLATEIMAMIGEIASYLSTSDPELTSLLRLDARIREQLTLVEADLAIVETETQRDELRERARTLRVQQIPLQRRMVEVVEAHRRYSSGPIKAIFDAIDRALDQLEALRRASA